MQMIFNTRIGGLFSVVVIAALAGCQGYELRGWVVQGEFGSVSVVDRDDPRLSDYTAARNVEIAVSRDPGRLSEEIVARSRSDDDGAIIIPIDAFGAGWMDEQWRIQSAGRGYRNVNEIVRLPANPKRHVLLITVVPGTHGPIEERQDPMQEFERFR